MARGTARLGRRFWLECGVLYVGLLCWMYIDSTSGASRFPPPMLDINGSYIDIPVNSTLRITCYGMYPLAWKVPPTGDNVSLRSSIYEESLEGLRPFKSVFGLNTTDVMDLGRYTCYHKYTYGVTHKEHSTSVYVFVNDDYYLFKPVEQSDQVVEVRPELVSVVPCLPTHSRAEVQLWKDLGKNEMELVDLAAVTPHNVKFDPMRGFIIYNPSDYFDGHFICNGTVHGRVYNDSSMAVLLEYLGPTFGGSRFLPPKLDINSSYIDIPAKSTLRITCYGMYPLSWNLPPTGDNVSLRSSIYEEKLEGLRPFKSVFELNTTDVMDLGRYTCYYNDPYGLTNTDHSTSVYVFINDDYYLFKPVKQRDKLVVVKAKSRESLVVPCLPTDSRAEVQLWKDLGKNKMELVALADLALHHVEFDPMRGFIIDNPYHYFHGSFICNGTVHGRVYNDSSMAVVLYYWPLVSTEPNVMIEAERSFHPVLNDTFTLNCTVTDFRCIMSWDYPNKNSSRIETTKPTVGGKHVGQGRFGLLALTSQLTVRDVQRRDEGSYTCYCKDYDEQKTYRDSVFVSVYGMRAPEFKLNGTNLRNEVRQDVSLIDLQCSATGLPEPIISWLKDGKPLNMSGIDSFNEGHWLIKRKVTAQDSGFYQCRAENRAGAIYANTTIVVASAGTSPAVLTNAHIALVTVFCIIFTCLLVGSFVYCKRYRADMKQENEMITTLFGEGQAQMFNPELPLSEQVELLPYDNRWEFPKDRLKLGRTLGQGAFGQVVKAEAAGLGDCGKSLTVAVKMLNDPADVSQRKALMAELKILIHLGRHLNIVNILGAVTKNVAKGELMVIVEYCKFGNLRHYLMRHRERFVNQLNLETGKVDPDMCYRPKSPLSPGGRPGFAISNQVQQQRQQRTPTLKYADLAMSATPSSMGNEFTFPVSDAGSTKDGRFPESDNHTALIRGSSLRDRGDMPDEALTTSDLLCFAFQCARGMEYLASRKLIHSDLAARNVLLSAENVVKICDFGLAKDCYKYSKYVRNGDCLLPVKWTAIESIMDRVFTTKSDVWSYGVLLWEIFSLGGMPYPGVVIDESFYKRLKNGYRMEKPDYAPDDVYDVMQKCWQAEPKERPDFPTLVCRLGDLLQAEVRDYYIQLNDPYANANMLLKNNDYLTMGGKPEPDYLDMKSDGENNINTSRAGAQVASTPHYATIATATTDGSAADGDAIEMVPMMSCGGDVQEIAPNSATSYVSAGRPTLQLGLSPGKRRDAPAPLLPPSGNPSGDGRASDDVSEECATPLPAYNLVVSVDGSGGIAV